MSDWKPGDVAMVRITDEGAEYLAIRTCYYGSQRYADGVWQAGRAGRLYTNKGSSARPLVVIDPESAEDVDRLYDIVEKLQETIPNDASADRLTELLAAALREFAAPTPPRPDEPQGLGAVVEDTNGRRWVNAPDNPSDHQPWTSAHSEGWRSWDAVKAVRVLSEGVTP